MKKKSLLLAIAAMSMAAVGVGTVGTFAWFTVGAAAGTASASNANSGTLTAATSTPESVGNFLIAVSGVSFDPATISLSDTAGNTYIDQNGASAGGKVAAEGTVNTTATVSMTVTYEGTAIQDAAGILAAWNLTKANYTFSFTVTDISYDESDYVANSGVKLAAADGNASTTNINRRKDTGTALSVSVAADTLDGTFTNNVLTVANAGQFKAALIGLDDTVQTANDPYKIELTPVVTANQGN